MNFLPSTLPDKEVFDRAARKAAKRAGKEAKHKKQAEEEAELARQADQAAQLAMHWMKRLSANIRQNCAKLKKE